jgi:hypothetical protein
MGAWNSGFEGRSACGYNQIRLKRTDEGFADLNRS